MLPKDSIANTLIVSLVLCIVCSLLVSGAAVSLKPLQQRNQLLDRQKNIIEAAGIVENVGDLTNEDVAELYESRVEPKLVDLSSGDYVEDADPNFDPRKAAKSAEGSTDIEGYDIGIAKREKKTWVYLVRGESGDVEKYVFPIYGMGLWSTLYGYIAVDSGLRTVEGLTYYEHAETPGLGGEVENPKWKSQWIGKKIWEEGEPRQDDNLKIGVAKGSPEGDNKKYMVDGLSGATITSRGVDTMLKYWFSDEGFGPFLKRVAAQEGASDGSTNS